VGSGDGLIEIGNVMSCQLIQESISGYLDNRLTERERKDVDAHLASCGECAALQEMTAKVRESLRSLTPVRTPQKLDLDLRILASRELLRQRQTGSLPALVQFWAARIRLLIDNLMRPLAVPCFGGFASALFIFGTLMPNLGFLRNPINDQPDALFTEASVDSGADFGARSKSSDDTLIEVQIDGQGRMVDYYVPQGQMTSEIGSFLLRVGRLADYRAFTTLTPSTKFLEPNTGKLIIRVSHIVVKG